jgi:hypothetical protein
VTSLRGLLPALLFAGSLQAASISPEANPAFEASQLELNDSGRPLFMTALSEGDKPSSDVVTYDPVGDPGFNVQTFGVAAEVIDTPEPATYLLLGAGLVAAARLRRRA